MAQRISLTLGCESCTNSWKGEQNNFSGRFSDAGPELSGSNHPNRLPKGLRRPLTDLEGFASAKPWEATRGNGCGGGRESRSRRV